MRNALLALLVFTTFAARAATVANDDSCDISVMPAATLLLPYFEVDLADRNGETTLFTVTNVTNLDQIAHITLWTDWGFPVIDFNVYLTGYDVQAIDLFDVFVRGIIAPDRGTGTYLWRRRGDYSDVNRSLNLSACDLLPGQLDPVYVTRMQHAFTRGSVPPFGVLAACPTVGSRHEHAVGYATIDTARLCTTSLPTDVGYFTSELAYDNVLIGDYQQVNGRENSAQGGPMVHIRAVPEGGGSRFTRTFYSRYQTGKPPADARQPLPSTFAARWIGGESSDVSTSLKVWREGRANQLTRCAGFASEERRRVTEIVVFDENENAVTTDQLSLLPLTSRTDVKDSDVYPQLANGASAGWMYLNLDYSDEDDFASQNWVITSMRAQGRFSTDVDSVALANGCSHSGAVGSQPTRLSADTSPAPRRAESPPLHLGHDADSCDIALLPAATLLLPYFQVDLDQSGLETTLFTITNVSPNDQIARVTLWTDGAYPVITFNVFLTGYDVQAINLYDVLARGIIAPDEGTGTRVRPRGELSHRNTTLDLSDCRQLPGALPAETIAAMQRAFTLGRIPNGCNRAGLLHDDAVGYATIDVVRSCSDNGPTDAAYWTNDILHDNVLTGDSQQVHPGENFAQGSPMVHIRAVPEAFPRTFYDRYQAAATPHRDGRQPLPATFAARWIQGGAAQFQTSYKIWREGASGLMSCNALTANTKLVFVESVVFDEDENAVANVPTCRMLCIGEPPSTAASGLHSVADYNRFPRLTNGAVAGWMYLNFDNDIRDGYASSNWVVTTMRAQGRFSVDMDAAALGNGCSRPVRNSEIGTGTVTIGPAPNVP